jgi:hypothetical protein
MNRQPLSAWVARLERERPDLVEMKREPDEHGNYADGAEVLDWLRDPVAKLIAGSEHLLSLIDQRPERAKRLSVEAGLLKKMAGLLGRDPLLTHEEFIHLFKSLMEAHKTLLMENLT